MDTELQQELLTLGGFPKNGAVFESSRYSDFKGNLPICFVENISAKYHANILSDKIFHRIPIDKIQGRFHYIPIPAFEQLLYEDSSVYSLLSGVGQRMGIGYLALAFFGQEEFINPARCYTKLLDILRNRADNGKYTGVCFTNTVKATMEMISSSLSNQGISNLKIETLLLGFADFFGKPE